MRISDDIEQWLKYQVHAGHFASEADALDAVVAYYQANAISQENDELVGPLLDEAFRSLAAGRGTPWQDGRAGLAEKWGIEL